MNTRIERKRRDEAEEPNLRERLYDLDMPSPLVDMTDMPWYPPYALDIWHTHNCLEIGLCLEGSGEAAVGDHCWNFSGGCVLVVPRGLPHYQSNAGKTMTHWRYLAVDSDRLLREIPEISRRAIREMLAGIARTGLFLEGSDAAEDIGRMIGAMFDLKRKLSEEALPELEAFLLQIMTRLCRAESEGILSGDLNSSQTRVIEPALLFISNNYAADLRVDQLARSCAMSEAYFRRVFARITSLSPLEYVNRYRVHRSMHLLRSTNEPVFNIAVRCGFPSVSTYNRNFLRYAGQTPSQWRRLHRGE